MDGTIGVDVSSRWFVVCVSLFSRNSDAVEEVAAQPVVGDIVFTGEEIVGMFLQEAVRLASAEAGAPVKDVVITVPVYFGQKQRQALLDAAEIAGINVLSLVNENTAAAIQYGIDLDYVADTTKTVVFYNMGSSSTQISLVKYSSYLEKVGKTNKTHGQFEVIASDWDENLGGLHFDMVIMPGCFLFLFTNPNVFFFSPNVCVCVFFPFHFLVRSSLFFLFFFVHLFPISLDLL